MDQCQYWTECGDSTELRSNGSIFINAVAYLRAIRNLSLFRIEILRVSARLEDSPAVDGYCSTQAVAPIIMMILASDEHTIARDMYRPFDQLVPVLDSHTHEDGRCRTRCYSETVIP